MCAGCESLKLNFCSTYTQVMYTEIPISSLGSLAYAEDDGKHILGVKAVQPVTMGGASLGRHTPTPSEDGRRHSVLYCCHVFECGNEASFLANKSFEHPLSPPAMR